MASLFQEILDRKPEEIQTTTQESLEWFQSNIRDIRRTPESLMKESQSFVSRFDLGHMYMYMYMPETRARLKYYDIFPLTVVIKKYPDGFLGFNLHYIAPRYRVQLMTYLYEVQETSQDSENSSLNYTYFRVRYPDVKSVSRLRWARPCLKRYHYRNVNSRIVEVQPEHMDFVTLLPSQRFRTGVNFNKFSALDVYKDSQKVHG